MPLCIKTKQKILLLLKTKRYFLIRISGFFLFCEIADSKKYLVNKYSATYHFLLKAGTPVFIDFVVISEFVNRYLRIAFSNYTKKNHLINFNYKKDYRQTDDFTEAWKNVCDIVNNRILSKTITINFEYDKSSFENLLDSNNSDTDFNDNHIMNLCHTNDLYLLTHDGDFKNSEINIITENQYYWKS